MWNSVKNVAANQFLPEPELVAFAVSNEEHFGIDLTDHLNPFVSNWHVDAMIDMFRKTEPVLCANVWAEKTKLLKHKNAELITQ